MKKPVLAFASIALAILFSACSPALVISPLPGQTAEARFSLRTGQTAESVIKRLLPAASQSNQSIFDPEALAAHLEKQGVRVRSVNPARTADLDMILDIPRSAAILNRALVHTAETGTITVTLSRAIIGDAIALLPPESADYLELLMAPVFTGEQLTAQDYRDTVGAMYGKNLARELDESFFYLVIESPGPISAARITEPGTVTSENRRARFAVPLVALLVMEKDVTATVTYTATAAK